MKKIIVIIIMVLMMSGCSIGKIDLGSSNKIVQIKIDMKEKNIDNDSINMPVVSGMKDEKVQKRINDLIKNKIDKIQYEIKKNMSDDSSPIDINSSMQYDNKNIISFNFTCKYLKKQEMQSITINTATGMEMYLKDIFNNDEDYKKIILDNIKNNVNSNKGKYNMQFYNSLSSIHYDQNFYMDDSNVCVYFNQANQTDIFKISYSAFKYSISSRGESLVLTDKINDNSGVTTVSVYYPEVYGEKYKNVNNEFKVGCLKYIDEIKNSLKSSTVSSNDKSSNKKYSVSIDYKMPYNKNNIISILQDYHSYTGGDNEISYISSTNINTKSGKYIKLQDLFKKDYDYKTVINDEIKKQIKDRKSLLLCDMFEKFSGITDDTEYYIEDDSLVIFFQTHDLSPDLLEKVKFRIPFSVFSDNIKLN